MNKCVRFLSVLLAFAIFICCFRIFAYDLDELDANTTVSGWAFSTQPGHMGTKDVNYAYNSLTSFTLLSARVVGAKTLWGTNINMTHTSSNSEAGIIFYINDLPSGTLAKTLVISVDSSTDHRTLCKIETNANAYATYTDEEWYIFIAHEIGHAYGLGHVNNSSSIMYSHYDPAMGITSNDIWGMKVVTHQHVHGTLFIGTYEVVDATYHTITCNSCKGKVTRVHAPNAYGVCACGYTGPFLYP